MKGTICTVAIMGSLSGTSAADKLFKSDKCRALAMRGGGTKGAYEVGALKTMSEMLDPKEIEYDIVEGVSIGGINSAIFSLYEKGNEKEAVKNMYDLWLNNPVTTLWSNWPVLGPIEGLWKQSLLNNENMAKLIQDQVKDKKFERAISI